MDREKAQRLAVGVNVASEMTGMSPSWWRREIKQSRVKATRLGDRLLVRVSEIERVLASGEQRAARSRARNFES